MRPTQSGRIQLCCIVALLLVAFGAYLDIADFNYREVAPRRAMDRYVPCPAGMHPKPDQPHICIPDRPAAPASVKNQEDGGRR